MKSDIRVAVAHNFYGTKNPSGENIAVGREVELLKSSNIEVYELFRYSDDLIKKGIMGYLSAAWNLHAPEKEIQSLANELRKSGSNLLHCHNIWPLITCGIWEAARRVGIPIVQTLHNYRLMASNTHFMGNEGAYRPGSNEEMLTLSRMPVFHNSHITNYLYTRALSKYWKEGVMLKSVDSYICFTKFQKNLLAKFNIPSSKISIKPNFIDYSGPIRKSEGEYALSIGRLSSEKGIDELCSMWRGMKYPLKIIGSGPLASSINGDNIEYMGSKGQKEVYELLANARYVVLNSKSFEGFPLVIIEAFASGTPCLVPNIGGLSEIVVDGSLGAVFEVGNRKSFTDKAKYLWENTSIFGNNCRSEYEKKYNSKVNLSLLVDIYKSVLGN